MKSVEIHRIQFEGGTKVPEGTVVTLIMQADKTLSATVTLPNQAMRRTYAKEDVEAVRDLEARFYKDGVLTWFDERDLAAGDKWKEKIDAGIDQSDCFLAFLSSASVTKTGYCQRELSYALEQQKLRPEGQRFIIPILLDECDPPHALSEFHWLKTSAGNWYEGLIQSIRTIYERSS
jgi:hypothetical protein